VANGNGVYLDFRWLYLTVCNGMVLSLVTLYPSRGSMEQKSNNGESTHFIRFAARVCHLPLGPLVYEQKANINLYATAAKSVPIFSIPPNACIRI